MTISKFKKMQNHLFFVEAELENWPETESFDCKSHWCTNIVTRRNHPQKYLKSIFKIFQ